MNEASIFIHNSVEEAVIWKDIAGTNAAKIVEFHVVRNGTEAGRSTVDVVFIDKNGDRFVAMLTGRLLRTVAASIGEEP